MNNKRTDLKPWKLALRVYSPDNLDLDFINTTRTKLLTRRSLAATANSTACDANYIIHRMIETVLDEDER